MKTIYSIRDRVANDLVGHQMYVLFVFRTDQQAMRYFADALFDETSILSKHKGDYELIALGMLTDEGTIPNGTMGEPPIPQVIVTGDQLVAAQQVQLVKEA